MSLHIFLALVMQLGLISAMPNPILPRDVTAADAANSDGKSWSKGKQFGVIVGCAVGGGIILFVWGWLLKGGKMWEGEKILWARSHFSFSKEAREEALAIRAAKKARRRAEAEQIWGKRGDRAQKMGTEVNEVQKLEPWESTNMARPAVPQEAYVK